MSVDPKPQGTLNFAFMDSHVKAARLPDPLNGEPDKYNVNGETNGLVQGGAIDPQSYMDVLN